MQYGVGVKFTDKMFELEKNRLTKKSLGYTQKLNGRNYYILIRLAVSKKKGVIPE